MFSSDRQAADDNEMQVTDDCRYLRTTDAMQWSTSEQSEEPPSPPPKARASRLRQPSKTAATDGDLLGYIEETAGGLQLRIKDATKKIEYMTLLKDQYSEDITEDERIEFERSITHYRSLICQWQAKLSQPEERKTPETHSGSHKRSQSSTPCTCASSKQAFAQCDDQKPNTRVDNILGKLESLLGLNRVKADLETRLTIILGAATSRLSREESQNSQQYEDHERSLGLTPYASADQILLHFSETDCQTSKLVLVEAGLYTSEGPASDPKMIDRAQLQLRSLAAEFQAKRVSLDETETALLRTRSLFEEATKKLQMAEALLEDLDSEVDIRQGRREELEKIIREKEAEIEDLRGEFEEEHEELTRVKVLKRELMRETEELVGLQVTPGRVL